MSQVSRTEPARSQRLILICLALLTLAGLAFRLWFAWRTNQSHPDTPARL
jgi:hypothetical protein